MLAPTAWGESFQERIDRLITTGKMRPVIAVLPDCFTIFGGAQYINSSALGRYEDYLVDELIPYVDAHYRTLPDRVHRAITGKSSAAKGRWCSRCATRNCSGRSRRTAATSTSSSATCPTWRSCTQT
ncbi:MAG: alpha/beta hydrolase-fold protein [Anaerolineae bacterium]